MLMDEMVLEKRGVRSDSVWIPLTRLMNVLRYVVLFVDTTALLKSQYWQRERLDLLCTERLLFVLKQSSAIPFWAQRFRKADIDIRILKKGDLNRLPVLSRKELTGTSEAINNISLMAWSIADRTSGSTGTPLSFFIDSGYMLRMYAICERMFRTAGGGKRFPILALRARERSGFAFYRYEFFFVRGYNWIKNRFDDFRKVISRHPEGVVLYGFASLITGLAHITKERKEVFPIKSVITSGEALSSHAEKLIRESFHCDVLRCYTTQELGWLAFECEQHQLHINEEVVYVEILDERDKPCELGREGRVVVTSFENMVMPFIRYDTGDLGTMGTALCPCGRTLRTITITGRESAYIQLPDNRVVPLLEITAAFDVYFDAIRQYQIIQTGLNAFTIRVVPKATFAAIRDELTSALIGRLHPDAKIDWREEQEIAQAESGKAILFVRES